MRLLVAGVTVRVLIGCLLGMVTVQRLPVAANPQILGRTAPTLLDHTVAVAVGIAGSFALVRRDVSKILAGVLVFTAAGYARVAAALGGQPRRGAKVLITVLVALLLIPLAGASLRTLEYELWMRATDDVAHAWVKGTAWKVESVKQAGSDIVILVVGQADTPPIDALREAVRRDVPRSVDVLVIEESGRTTAL